MTFRLSAPSVTPISETLALNNAKVFFFSAGPPRSPPVTSAAANATQRAMKELLDTCGPDGAAAAVQERLGNIAENADKPLKHPGSLAENARDLAQEPLSAVREHGDGAGEVPQQEGEKLKREALADGLDGMPGNLPGGFFGKKG